MFPFWPSNIEQLIRRGNVPRLLSLVEKRWGKCTGAEALAGIIRINSDQAVSTIVDIVTGNWPFKDSVKLGKGLTEIKQRVLSTLPSNHKAWDQLARWCTSNQSEDVALLLRSLNVEQRKYIIQRLVKEPTRSLSDGLIMAARYAERLSDLREWISHLAYVYDHNPYPAPDDGLAATSQSHLDFILELMESRARERARLGAGLARHLPRRLKVELLQHYKLFSHTLLYWVAAALTEDRDVALEVCREISGDQGESGSLRRAMRFASAFGLQEYLPQAHTALLGKDTDLKWFAIQCIASSNDRDSVPILIDLLVGDSDQRMRQASAMALGHLKAIEAEDLLIQMAVSENTDASLRIAILEALGYLGTSKARETLLRLARAGSANLGVILGIQAWKGPHALAFISDDPSLAHVAQLFRTLQDPDSPQRTFLGPAFNLDLRPEPEEIPDILQMVPLSAGTEKQPVRAK